MSVFAAIRRGLGAALSAPKLVGLLWLATLLLALPATFRMGESVRGSTGSSLAGREMRGALELGWWGEYEDRARGVETALTPRTLGATALVENLEGWFGGGLFARDRGLVALGVLYALVWAFLLGGAIDYLSAGGGRLSVGGLVATGSRYWFRFVRLAVLAGGAYFLIYRLAGKLFPWIERLTRDVTVEKAVLLYNLLGAAVIVLLLALVNVIFDYAKICTVLEERRSMFFAALSGLGFVLSHPVKTLGVYCGLGLLAAALPFAYLSIAPSPAGATLAELGLAILVGQLFLLARLMLRVAFYGAQTAVYESVYGHSLRAR